MDFNPKQKKVKKNNKTKKNEKNTYRSSNCFIYNQR